MSGSGLSPEETGQVAGALVPRRDTFRMYRSCRWLLLPSKYVENFKNVAGGRCKPTSGPGREADHRHIRFCHNSPSMN